MLKNVYAKMQIIQLPEIFSTSHSDPFLARRI